MTSLFVIGQLSHPLPDHPFYMVIETAGSRDTHDEEKLSLFLEEAMQRELVSDGVLATDTSQVKVGLTDDRRRSARAVQRGGNQQSLSLAAGVASRRTRRVCCSWWAA